MPSKVLEFDTTKFVKRMNLYEDKYFSVAKRAMNDNVLDLERKAGELWTFREGDFRYRAGCTLLIDPASMTVRRVIRTAGTIKDNDELERQRRFMVDGGLEPNNAYSPAVSVLRSKEPFAILHRHGG